MSEHAEVKQEHRELAGILSDVHYHLSDERTCATCNSDFSDIRHIPAKMRAREYMSQLLADHDAEVERRLLRNFLSDSISHDEHVHGVRDSCWLCNTLGGTNG